MEQKYYQTKSFSKLKKQWYKELKKSGFKDQEFNEQFLLTSSISHGSPADPDILSQNTEVERDAKQDYYRYAEAFQNTNTFKNYTTFEQCIWEFHANGDSLRTISKKLKKQVKNTINKDIANKIVNRIKKEMFKEYGVSTKG